MLNENNSSILLLQYSSVHIIVISDFGVITSVNVMCSELVSFLCTLNIGF